MLAKVADRFHIAFQVFAEGGNLEQVTETLFYGDYTDDFAIETPDPLYHSPNWDTLLDTIGLTFVDRKEDLTKGNVMSYDFQDKGAVSLSIDVDDKNPTAHFTINSRIWYAYFNIKQNPDNGEYQIDYAFIGDKRYNPAYEIEDGVADPGEIIPVATSCDDEAKELLPLFFHAFTDIGSIITSDTPHLKPHEVERQMTDHFSPILLRLHEIDAEQKRAFDQEIANGGTLVTGNDKPQP